MKNARRKQSTVFVGRMPHRKWRENKLQLTSLTDLALLSISCGASCLRARQKIVLVQTGPKL